MMPPVPSEYLTALHWTIILLTFTSGNRYVGNGKKCKYIYKMYVHVLPCRQISDNYLSIQLYVKFYRNWIWETDVENSLKNVKLLSISCRICLFRLYSPQKCSVIWANKINWYWSSPWWCLTQKAQIYHLFGVERMSS